MTTPVRTDDGAQLWASQLGRGTPLVFCHGGPGLWDMAGELATALAPVARTIRWDQRGCGRSARRGPYTMARSLAGGLHHRGHQVSRLIGPEAGLVRWVAPDVPLW